MGIDERMNQANTLISVYKEDSLWAARISAKDKNGEIVNAFTVGKTPAEAIISLGHALLGKDFPFAEPHSGGK